MRCVDVALWARVLVEPFAQTYGRWEEPVKVFVNDIRVVADLWPDAIVANVLQVESQD